MKIEINKPFLGHKEILGVVRVLKSGRLGGNGVIGQKLEKLLRDFFKVNSVLLVTSCTHALEMSLMALGIKENDEVILPSFCFVSAANSVVRLKARPIFVDVEEGSLNIDPLKIEAAITKKTKAIICIHYAGLSCKMDEIKKIAEKNNLFIIEDAAHAVGSEYKNEYLGTIGDIGCLSFHETKNLTCGEGGAFITNNKKIAKKAEIIREKGTDRSAFLRGEVDKYTWREVGSSYVLSDVLAAILLEQFKKMPRIIEKRKIIGLKYIQGFQALQKNGKIILPEFPANKFNWHIFYFRVNSQAKRDHILQELKKRKIGATFHFLPMHLSSYARKIFGYKKGDFPVSERVSRTLIRLPIYPDLSDKKQKYIINSVCRIMND